MDSATQLIFRASAAQRGIAFILTLGCLWVAGRGMALALQTAPKIWHELKLAQSQAGEPTALIWLSLVATCLALLIAGLVMLLAILAYLLIEGTQIHIDELGLSVLCLHLPSPVAKRLGSGRILWKNISSIERGGFYFALYGQETPNTKNKEVVKFLVVEHLEKLIFIVMERSPNLKLI